MIRSFQQIVVHLFTFGIVKATPDEVFHQAIVFLDAFKAVDI